MGRINSPKHEGTEHMKKGSATLLAASLLIGLCTLATSESSVTPEEASRTELLIQMEGEFLQVKARDVPHRQILEGLAKSLGFDLIIEGPLAEPRSLDLQGERGEVLKKSLYPASWAFLYEPTQGGPRLAKVVVFPPKVETDSSVQSHAEPAVELQPPSSLIEQEDRLEALKEQLTASEDAREQLSALYSIATLGRPADLVQALSRLAGEPVVEEPQEAVEEETEELRHAIQEMWEAVSSESQPIDRP